MTDPDAHAPEPGPHAPEPAMPVPDELVAEGEAGRAGGTEGAGDAGGEDAAGAEDTGVGDGGDQDGPLPSGRSSVAESLADIRAERILSEARREARSLIDAARVEARREARAIVEDARVEAENIMTEAFEQRARILRRDWAIGDNDVAAASSPTSDRGTDTPPGDAPDEAAATPEAPPPDTEADEGEGAPLAVPRVAPPDPSERPGRADLPAPRNGDVRAAAAALNELIESPLPRRGDRDRAGEPGRPGPSDGGSGTPARGPASPGRPDRLPVRPRSRRELVWPRSLSAPPEPPDSAAPPSGGDRSAPPSAGDRSAPPAPPPPPPPPPGAAARRRPASAPRGRPRRPVERELPAGMRIPPDVPDLDAGYGDADDDVDADAYEDAYEDAYDDEPPDPPGLPDGDGYPRQ
ncbi:MAG TPA: hypothetical protein VE575_00545 [Acidimicrobiales bacterium]|nr:hypothetical protein [Acidimicrobiales bacterium]